MFERQVVSGDPFREEVDKFHGWGRNIEGPVSARCVEQHLSRNQQGAAVAIMRAHVELEELRRLVGIDDYAAEPKNVMLQVLDNHPPNGALDDPQNGGHLMQVRMLNRVIDI